MNIKMRFPELTDEEILQTARERDDLGDYDEACLLNRVRNCYMHYGDIDDCLDELSHYKD